MSLSDWNGVELFLAGDKYGEWIHGVFDDPPKYLAQHRGNMVAAENQDYFVDVLNYSEEY